MTRQEIIEEIKEKFADEELLNDVVEELDSWNGYLGDDRYYLMEDMYEYVAVNSPSDLENFMARIFYGKDEDTGNEFNPNREYFKWDGYGNLVSTDYKEYCVDEDDIIDEVVDNYGNLSIMDAELDELFEKLAYEDYDDGE